MSSGPQGRRFIIRNTLKCITNQGIVQILICTFTLVQNIRRQVFKGHHLGSRQEPFDQEHLQHRPSTAFYLSCAHQNSCSGMSKVKHSTSPPRLAMADLTLDLPCGRFPSLAGAPSPLSFTERQTPTVIMCDDEILCKNCLCFVLLTTQQKKKETTKQLQPNCSAEIPTSVVDPDKSSIQHESILPSSNRERWLREEWRRGRTR